MEYYKTIVLVLDADPEAIVLNEKLFKISLRYNNTNNIKNNNDNLFFINISSKQKIFSELNNRFRFIVNIFLKQ